jgi:hypothetical protein
LAKVFGTHRCPALGLGGGIEIGVIMELNAGLGLAAGE